MPMPDGGKEESIAYRLAGLLRTDTTLAGTLAATGRVFEALRVSLSTVLGGSGYAMLLSRSLVLSRREYPWLGAITADRNGSLVERLGAADGQTPAQLADGFAGLLTRFASLLSVFIGADLCDVLLGTVWHNLQNNGASESSGVDDL